jgi:hypothetical protein
MRLCDLFSLYSSLTLISQCITTYSWFLFLCCAYSDSSWARCVRICTVYTVVIKEVYEARVVV